MSADLSIQLLGDFRARYRGEVLTIDSPRLQALVAYLALHRGAPQQRRRLAFLFWPDSAEAQALTNLRQLLHHLRRALPHPDRYLRVKRGTLAWRVDATTRVDVLDLQAALSAAEAATEAGDIEAAIAADERAASFYTGDLLPSCYEAWIEPERDRLRRRTAEALERLVSRLASRHEHARAIPHAERLLELDPLSERAHRSLMRLHALSGDPARAARVYQRCVEVLERELGVEPSPDTRALHEGVLRGDAVRAGRSDARASPVAAPPLVGRAAEWERLESAWRDAAEGQAAVVLVTGEAGIGKSRLAESLAEWAERQGIATARARCWAAEGVLPLAPVAQWLRSAGLRDRIAALEAAFRADVARLLPELAPEAAPEPGLEPWRRTRLFDALARAVGGVERPLLLLLDDLQWCDGETLEWLHYLLRRDSGAPILLLVTLRSGEPAADPRLSSWLLQLRQIDRLTQLDLAPLEPTDTAALGAAVAGRALEDGEATRLHRETEGNPLFVVETMRSRPSEEGGRPADRPSSRLPVRVHAVIRARLERLSQEARELVPLLATIGRDFEMAVVRAASGFDVEPLARTMDELVRGHIIRERQGGYDFAHDKIREVAYAELTAARRSILHERVARALESAGARAPEAVAGEIARHLERAGLGAAAIPWYRRAADRARTLFANKEAAHHLDRALALLAREPDSTERAERELELQIALGVPLVAIHHYSGARVWKAYDRARDLCARIGRPPSPPILRGLALASLMMSRLPDVLEVGRELMRAAEQNHDPMLQVEAHYVLGVAFYWHGQIGAARSHLQRGLTLYDPRRGPEHLSLFAQDPGIICGVRLALADWHLGRSADARRRCLAALDRAESLAHPFSLAYARVFGSWVLVLCGDLAATRRQVAALLRESEEHGMAVWPAMGRIIEGWVMASDGRIGPGLERIERGFAECEAQEVDLGFPFHQALYADVCRRAGRGDAALEAVDEALLMASRTGERFWDADLYRIRGELLRDRGAATGAVDAAFSRAVETARSQGAPGLERRALAAQNAAGTVHR